MTEIPPRRTGWRVAGWMFGVLSPLVALLCAYPSGGDSAELLRIQPLPTVWHGVAILGVAAMNAVLLMRRPTPEAPRPSGAAWTVAWGLATGVAFSYTVIFAPATPLSIVAILMMGIGLLPLSPLTSLITLIAMRPRMRAVPAVVAALGGVVALSLPEVPRYVADRGFALAARGDAGATARAVERLRALPASVVLDAATAPHRGVSLLYAIPDAVRGDERDVRRYAAYLATGRVAELRPADRRRLFDDRPLSEEEEQQGGLYVGSRVDGLCVAESVTDGTADTRAAVAELNWDLVVRNSSDRDAEFRALVTLPEGGVVSEAHLWVNDTPRPAIFAATAKAREAYENVVRVQRRDPLLVTSRGPGAVLVQGFPVPGVGDVGTPSTARGNTMRVRLRVAAPLVPDGAESFVLEMPRIASSNFVMCEGTRNVGRLTVIGDITGAAPNVSLVTDEAGVVQAAWDLDATAALGLAAPFVLRTSDAPARRETTVTDPFGSVARNIVQRWVPAPPPAARRIVVVIDTDAATAGMRPSVAAMLGAVPADVEVAAFAAAHDVVELTDGFTAGGTALAERVGAALDRLPKDCGIDALATLRHAAAFAGRGEPTPLLMWLHGPQPLVAPEPESGMDSWDRRRSAPKSRHLTVWTAIPLTDGDNALIAHGVVEVVAAPIAATPARRFERWLRRAIPAEGDVVAARTAEPPRTRPAAPAPDAHGVPTRVIAALWAADQAGTPEGPALAVSHRIVTPATAAVVLESEEAERAAGLVTDDGSPTVPEPGEWAVIVIVVLAVGVFTVRRRRAAAA